MVQKRTPLGERTFRKAVKHLVENPDQVPAQAALELIVRLVDGAAGSQNGQSHCLFHSHISKFEFRISDFPSTPTDNSTIGWAGEKFEIPNSKS